MENNPDHWSRDEHETFQTRQARREESPKKNNGSGCVGGHAVIQVAGQTRGKNCNDTP